MSEKFNVGGLVQSAAGRDADKYYFIVAKEGDFAYICNGKLHKVDKPKKKKLKHLKGTEYTYEMLTGMPFDGNKVTNPALKKAIYTFYSGDFNKDF